VGKIKAIPEWARRNSPVLIVAVTVVYTCFSYRQFRAMDSQASVMNAQLGAMNSQLNVMKSQLKAEMGKPVVVSVAGPYHLEHERAVAPTLTIGTAKSSAELADCKLSMWALPITDSPPDIDLLDVPTQPCSGTVTDRPISFFLSKRSTDKPEDLTVEKQLNLIEQLRLVRSGKLTLYYVGRMTYYDVLDQRGSLKFCKYYIGDGESAWQDCRRTH
jgi:hypothetical protein